MTARPAANLPLITSSRWIGWERSRGRVPRARSPLTASNANAIPSSGPTIATKSDADGIWTPVSATFGAKENIDRNSEERSVICEAAVRIASAVKYIGMSAAIPRTMSRTTKRADQRWSVNSLPDTTIQPAWGTDRSRRDGMASSGRRRARGAGAGSATGAPEPVGRGVLSAVIGRPSHGRGRRARRLAGRSLRAMARAIESTSDRGPSRPRRRSRPVGPGSAPTRVSR